MLSGWSQDYSHVLHFLQYIIPPYTAWLHYVQLPDSSWGNWIYMHWIGLYVHLYMAKGEYIWLKWKYKLHCVRSYKTFLYGTHLYTYHIAENACLSAVCAVSCLTPVIICSVICTHSSCQLAFGWSANCRFVFWITIGYAIHRSVIVRNRQLYLWNVTYITSYIPLYMHVCVNVAT